MRTDLFDFDLPPERIALRPETPRDAARLLVVRPGSEPGLTDTGVRDLPEFLRPGDALVVNETKVIAARLRVHCLRELVALQIRWRESETESAGGSDGGLLGGRSHLPGSGSGGRSRSRVIDRLLGRRCSGFLVESGCLPPRRGAGRAARARPQAGHRRASTGHDAAGS